MERPPLGGGIGEAGLQLLDDGGFGSGENGAPERGVFEGPELDCALIAGDDLKTQPEGRAKHIRVLAGEQGFAVGERLVAIYLETNCRKQRSLLFAGDDEELGHVAIELIPGQICPLPKRLKRWQVIHGRTSGADRCILHEG